MNLRDFKLRLWLPILIILAVAYIFAVPVYAQQAIDEESTRLIREYTTSEKFLSPLVDHLPDSDEVPSPREVLGYVVGTPEKLTYYEDIIRYMKTLSEKSSAVELFPIGPTDEGRTLYIVVISDPQTINDLEHYKNLTAALADPRLTPEAEAQKIIAQAKPMYWITCNLHSSENGSAEMSMELAYRLAVSEEPLIKAIRQNCIVMITPCAEPDGHDRYTDWYYRYTKGITDEEERFPGPPYWGKYVYHDNNRDGLQVSQLITSAFLQAFMEWHPQVWHDLHESIALLYVSTGTGPYYPTFDPIVMSEWQLLSHWEVEELTKMGMPGVWTHAFFTGWYPGYLSFLANTHNAIGRFYETFGNGGATTMERKLADRERGRLGSTKQEWYRPLPPDDKVTWSIRNNINYQQTALLCVLKLVASQKDTFLYNFWKKGKNAIEKGKSEPPYAWVIPADQRHPVETVNVINLLRTQGVEGHRLDKEFKIEEKSYPAGSFVIRMDQPYRVCAKTYLEVQKYPADAGRSYDDVGWTIGYLRGVETVRIDEPSILEAPMTLLKGELRATGTVVGGKARRYYAIPHQGTNNMMTARFLLPPLQVFAVEEEFQAGERVFPPGSWLIPAGEKGEQQLSKLRDIAGELGLIIYALDEEVEVKKHAMDLPRIAVYHTWSNTQDSGWVRYAFDAYKIPYKLISKDRLRAGGLNDDFDVIVFPSQGGYGDAKRIVHGIDPEKSPMPYTRTEQFKFHGVIDSTEDMTGGMGLEGLVDLQRFVQEGGVLITLGSASTVPLSFGLVGRIGISREGRGGAQGGEALFVPGSIIKGEVVNDKSPITYGYQKGFPIFYRHSFLFSIPKKEERFIVVKYADTDDLCLSGLVKGAKVIKGKAAVVDYPVGNGRIVMFSFNPLHRFMTQGDFMLVFNILLNYNHLGS